MPLIPRIVVLLQPNAHKDVQSDSGRYYLSYVLCISGNTVFDGILLSAVPSGQRHCP